MGKYSETETEVYRFLIILGAVVIFILGIYFITTKVVNKNSSSNEETKETEISETAIIVGSLLNRPQKEYYVLAFKSSDNDNVVYQTYLSVYSSKENSKKIYSVDLDNALNSKYYSESTNTKATKIDELKISSPTLIKVSDGHISKYIEGKDNITKELGI